MIKVKKTYEELVAEGLARATQFNAKVEAYPDYPRIAAEVRAEYAEACKDKAAVAKATREMYKAVQEAEELATKREMERVRKNAHLTQKEIAKRMGVSQPTVAQALTGRVTVATLRRFFNACGQELVISSRPLEKPERPEQKVRAKVNPAR